MYILCIALSCTVTADAMGVARLLTYAIAVLAFSAHSSVAKDSTKPGSIPVECGTYRTEYAPARKVLPYDEAKLAGAPCRKAMAEPSKAGKGRALLAHWILDKVLEKLPQSLVGKPKAATVVADGPSPVPTAVLPLAESKETGPASAKADGRGSSGDKGSTGAETGIKGVVNGSTGPAQGSTGNAGPVPGLDARNADAMTKGADTGKASGKAPAEAADSTAGEGAAKGKDEAEGKLPGKAADQAVGTKEGAGVRESGETAGSAPVQSAESKADANEAGGNEGKAGHALDGAGEANKGGGSAVGGKGGSAGKEGAKVENKADQSKGGAISRIGEEGKDKNTASLKAVGGAGSTSIPSGTPGVDSKGLKAENRTLQGQIMENSGKEGSTGKAEGKKAGKKEKKGKDKAKGKGKGKGKGKFFVVGNKAGKKGKGKEASKGAAKLSGRKDATQ